MPFHEAQTIQTADFDAIRLRLASPEIIRSWSYGEVTKPETINYRTQKPEKDGLFDERIFGPTKDWECYCGKYKKIRYKGIICDKCGVEVIHSLVRRERMGHIDLVAPVSHIWFLRGVPSKIGLALDVSVQNLEKVIYFANFIITRVDEEARLALLEQVKGEYKGKKKSIESEYSREAEQIASAGDGPAAASKAVSIRDRKLKELEENFRLVEGELKELAPLKIISESAYQELSLKYGHVFDAGIGAEAVLNLLKKIDIDKTIAAIEKNLAANPESPKTDRIIRRIKLLKSLRMNGLRPEWMILTNIPVIPPDLRPMVALDGGRFATSDLNDLYRRVINRNNRLRRLLELNAPEVITRNEKRMLQEAVDALIDNSARQSKTVVAAVGKKRQLRSLADVLKGKQGRFRQNLLGKRIDYSGRSVIVVGPNLKLHQCGLPKRMALELFRPFVMSKLISLGFVHNIRSANRFIESGRSEIWDILEEITRSVHVLLNRAPTLHRLGIQAFQPILIEGKAIQIHPMVCTAFNADFDGDQMAVHVPLTDEARAEAANIMLSAKNLLKPATGSPVATPNRDIAWGVYYMTMMRDKPGGKTKFFANSKEAIFAHDSRCVDLREKILVRMKKGERPIETTVGRILLNQILPEKLPFINEIMDIKKLGEMMRLTIEYYGRERAAALLDDVKQVGFKHITRSGYSWGMDELPNLAEHKQKLIEEGDRRVNEIEEQYNEGLLTNNERHTKIVEVWTAVKDQVTKLSKEKLHKDSSVFTMVESGARGSWGQLTQMVGMKGLVSNPAGDIIELPIKAGFKEGFGVLEYFISTHGTRKGLSDTALRTANAGYLTRRLVDVAQDMVIRAEDCGDEQGMVLTAAESEMMGESLIQRIVGRFTLANIVDPKTKKVIVKKGEVITEANGREIAKRGVAEAHVRSVLKCMLRRGVCRKCYGFDLAYNKPVELGVSVGIIAAQSIGEPGTQLTMRTFHTGGVAGLDITQGLPRVEELFEARAPKRRAIITDVAGKVVIEEAERRVVESGEGRKLLETGAGQRAVRVNYVGLDEKRYRLIKSDEVKVKDGEKVVAGAILITRADGSNVVAEHSGNVKIGKREVIFVWEGKRAKEFLIPPGYAITVKDGDEVAVGDQLTEGDLDLHELYALKGRSAVEDYLLRGIQSIYLSQGQKLNDKHIELIIRQMFSRIYVKDAGDTDMLPGEVVERAQFEEENEKAKKNKKKLAQGDELFLGISKVSLSTQSFLSAASFQETARVLINAAVTGKVDPLEGLKENVIIGRLIPAGTGFGQRS